MFLNEMNKNEAIAFINLVRELVKVDNDFAKEEKRLVEEYMEELQLKDSEVNNLNYDEIMDVLKVSSSRIKSIVYFELVGLSLIDGNYDEKENDFLEKVGKDLNIERYKKIAFANYFFEFKEIYDISVVDAEGKIKLLKEKAEALL